VSFSEGHIGKDVSFSPGHLMGGKEEIQRKTPYLEKDDKFSFPFQREKQLLSLFTLTITPEIGQKYYPL